MKYCIKCGNQLDDMAVICPHCGVPQEAMQPKEANPGDVLWFILALLSPLIGLILFAVWKTSKPKRAKLMITAALISFVLVVIMSVIQGTV
ncbi:MAG: zinc ribbon domain-containing protein [Lachnospiraceae bacterium]|nr:zinc ribbon domain-containing protein [Lachnospiraceae bacterium]